MSEQHTALWLADWLDVRACGGDNWNATMNAAASELRRLSAVEAQRDALLSALLWIDKRCPQAFMDCPLHTIHREMAHDAGACARAAIKKAEEGK